MSLQATNAALPHWQREMRDAVRDPVELCERLELPVSCYEKARLAAAKFPVFAPQCYLNRMQKGDLDDPLLRQVLPLAEELESPANYSIDPVDDQSFKLQPGLLQKYRGRVLLISTGLCAIHCRYCFRKNFPYANEPQSLSQWQPALEQVATDASIHEVILSGGDPLTMSDGKLAKLFDQLDTIPHLTRLRIHTRLPIVIPSRVTTELLDRISSTRMTVFLVVHANHAHELNQEVWNAIGRLREAHAILLNQTVLLRGVNDSVDALRPLFEQLSDHGVLPYYLHQLDPVQGAAHFEVSIQRGLDLVAALRAVLPGYAVPRYVQEIAGDPNKRILA